MTKQEIRVIENQRDSILIVNHQHGDKKAFGVLTGYHLKELNYMNYHALHNWEDAEDATQEELIILFCSLNDGKYVEHHVFGGWLILMVRNYLSHVSHHAHIVTVPMNKEVIGMIDELVFEDLSNEQLMRLKVCGDKLPERDRQLIQMRFWKKYSWKAIGIALNMTETGASKEYIRVIKRLYIIMTAANKG